MTHKDGHEVYIESSGIPLFDKQGNFKGYQVNNRDISKRSRSEEIEATFREDAYSKLLYYQEVMTNISQRFMETPFKELEHSINTSLADLGKLLKVCRVYVFEFDESKQSMSNTFEWCFDDIEPAIDVLKNLSVDIFPWWMQKLKNNEVINVFDVNEMDSEQLQEKEILIAQGIKSVLVVPIYVNSELLGFIGFDSVKKRKRFSDEIHLIQMHSDLIGYALLKVKDEHRVSESIIRVIKAFHQTVEVFLSLIEISDPYMCDHQRHVTKLSLEIANRIEFDCERVEALYFEAMLHDIVKFYIPKQILNKTG